jgi:putative restriction endonuclease
VKIGPWANKTTVTFIMNQLQYAGRAWPILTSLAASKETITYGDLAGRLGIHWRSCRLFLAVIQDFCLEEQLAPLTALVVQQSTGNPGGGFIAWDIDDAETAWQKVFGYPWNEIRNPFRFANNGDNLDELVTRLLEYPDGVSEVYALVRTRGIRQALFRELLLRVYGSYCAMTGTAHVDLLEAAHILPWNECTPEKRFDIRNGLLLSKLHHHLFDKDWLRIDWKPTDEKYVVTRGPELPAVQNLSRFENWVVNNCINERLILRADKKYWPAPEYLAARYR